MTENRIRVRMDPELTPVRLEDKMDVNTEIRVAVESHLKGLGVAGLVCMALGFLLILVAAVMFAAGYPDKYHASNGVSLADSHAFIETFVLTSAAGFVLFLFGTSSFFYGRTVLGSGHLDDFSMGTEAP
jgi:hypothetical protein